MISAGIRFLSTIICTRFLSGPHFIPFAGNNSHLLCAAQVAESVRAKLFQKAQAFFANHSLSKPTSGGKMVKKKIKKVATPRKTKKVAKISKSAKSSRGKYGKTSRRRIGDPSSMSSSSNQAGCAFWHWTSGGSSWSLISNKCSSGFSASPPAIPINTSSDQNASTNCIRGIVGNRGRRVYRAKKK